MDSRLGRARRGFAGPRGRSCREVSCLAPSWRGLRKTRGRRRSTSSRRRRGVGGRGLTLEDFNREESEDEVDRLVPHAAGKEQGTYTAPSVRAEQDSEKWVGREGAERQREAAAILSISIRTLHVRPCPVLATCAYLVPLLHARRLSDWLRCRDLRQGLLSSSGMPGVPGEDRRGGARLTEGSNPSPSRPWPSPPIPAPPTAPARSCTDISSRSVALRLLCAPLPFQLLLELLNQPRLVIQAPIPRRQRLSLRAKRVERRA